MFVPVPFFVLVNYKSWSCFAQFPSRSVLTVWGCKTSWLKWTDPQLPYQCAHGSWLVCKMFHTNNQVELYEWSAYLWHFTSHTWQEWMCKATCKTQANRKSSESRSMGSTWIWLQARWSQVGRSVSELRTAACFFCMSHAETLFRSAIAAVSYWWFLALMTCADGHGQRRRSTRENIPKSL